MSIKTFINRFLNPRAFTKIRMKRDPCCRFEWEHKSEPCFKFQSWDFYKYISNIFGKINNFSNCFLYFYFAIFPYYWEITLLVPTHITHEFFAVKIAGQWPAASLETIRYISQPVFSCSLNMKSIRLISQKYFYILWVLMKMYSPEAAIENCSLK